MSQINCHIPIKLRITGRPSDAQLEQLGEDLVRALTARIAFAERTIASHNGGRMQSGEVEIVREEYNPALEDISTNGYLIPSYHSGGIHGRIAIGWQRRGRRRWRVMNRTTIYISVRNFIEFLELLSDPPTLEIMEIRTLYPEQLDVVYPAFVWMVVPSEGVFLLDHLVIEVVQHIKENGARFVKPDMAWYSGYSIHEADRQVLADLEETNRVRQVPNMSSNDNRVVRISSSETILSPGAKLLFVGLNIKPGPTAISIVERVIRAVIDILQGFGFDKVYREDRPGVLRNVVHPDAHPEVPEAYRELLWNFYKAVVGKEYRQGHWVEALGRRRRFWIDEGLREIGYLLEIAAREFSKEQLDLIEMLYQGVGKVLRRATEEEAREMVEQAGERLAALVAPEQALQEDEIRTTIKTALTTLNDASRLLNAVRSSSVDDAFSDLVEKQNEFVIKTKIYQENQAEGVLAKRLQGVRTSVAIGYLRDVTSAVKAIMELTDPRERQKMFDERLGKIGYVRGSVAVIEKVLSITRGVVSALCLITAAIGRVAGYADEVARLIAASRNVSSLISKPINVLAVVRGTITLFHPESTRDEQVNAVIDIAIATGGLIGGAAGGGITGAALAFKVDLEIFKKGVEATRGMIWVQMSQCYQRMAEDGKYIALYGNRVYAAQILLMVDQDPERRAALERERDGAAFWLQATLFSLLEDAFYTGEYFGSARKPAAYLALRWRFAPVVRVLLYPPVDSPLWDPLLLIGLARRVLRIIEEAFKDRDNILDEEVARAWKGL